MAEALKVQGEDGEIREFGEKSKVKKESYIAESGDVVTKFVFRNGAVRTHITPASDVTMLSLLAKHGADQKFGDEFAGLDDVEDCIEAFEATSARLSARQWNEKRESDGLAGQSLLARALVEVTGASMADVRAKLTNTPKETKAALAKQARIKAVIERLKEERDAKKGKAVDADAALAAFVG